MSNRRRTLERSGATMHEIADACGVSHTTVSFVLRGRLDMAIGADTRQRVFREAIAADYHPQRNSRLDAAKLRILYMCPDLRKMYTDFALPMNVLVELAEREAATGVSFELAVFERSRMVEYLYRGICESQVDGVIISRVGDDVVRDLCEILPVPLFYFGHGSDLPCDSVGVDDSSAGYLAARHLWQHGHRHVAIFSVHQYVGDARNNAFLSEWRKLGGDPDRVEIYAGVFETSSGRAMLEEFLARPAPRPTAVFAVSDTIAYGVYDGLWHHDLSVPDDLSIIGCDDISYSQICCPALTTMRHDNAALARNFLERIQIRCRNDSAGPPVGKKLPVSLVHRASVRQIES